MDGALGLILGISIGLGIGLLLACAVFLCIRANRRRIERRNWSERSTAVLPIRVNGVDSSSVMSDSSTAPQALASKEAGLFTSWLGGRGKRFTAINAGITRFSYRELQKATNNFTTLLGQGAFGPVYRATQPSGVVLAVKVLASNSKQGEREFETEVILMGRLHHRNLVNLVGYCTEREHRMLVYEYMSNGSLADLLSSKEPLKWDWRVRVSQDIARGIEYLHDGAVPPVIHRDIKSANVLLDYSMRARVADFGLSKELSDDVAVSGFRGTFGYIDPQFIATKTFTEKSDVYSFGVLLFEIITGRSPQQGLMDYVQLAAMDSDSVGWTELADIRLDGKCNLDEVAAMASIAHSCLEPLPSKRPRMREVAQSLQLIGKKRLLVTTDTIDQALDHQRHHDHGPQDHRHQVPYGAHRGHQQQLELEAGVNGNGLPRGEWSKPFHQQEHEPTDQQ
ncbi:calcium/calmodulin-regulated receptor-like kinase 1 [Selaginella moellendorffii]|uniref:calcium/calmodulin-regulated receptor-like kinase 1 n=1 Tax=Selaginella moellendorffii TaxID=88036 RepID=UPI000D1C6915|nr:calcium/calmodulin-regulated receptor-like kinase 1 [Selaginella moellendorffii]|eukprot:XP_024542383.1 calcium/calmodulin-regulated receptor-like kinase 1 [Selaginella moellendorffii]